MKAVFAFAFFLVSAGISYSQVDPVDKDGVAIGGYDVVSYFNALKPVKGTSTNKHTYNNITYHFATADNLQAFKANPEKYVPQYEGYCALGVSYGKKISIDPLTYRLIDNKLYLFYNGKTSHGRVNSLDTWSKDEARLLKKADKQWPDVRKVKYKKDDEL